MLTANELWQFSCHYYGKPGVMPACLCVQDEHQGNVNLLLLLVYLDQQELALSDNLLKSLHQSIQQFSSQTTMLQRRTRIELKRRLSPEDYAKTKPALLEAELALEKLEQAHLLELLEAHSPSHNTHSTTNLARYLKLLDADQELIHTLTA